ncbi:syntaxin-17 [Microplitis demolitor]|uniref:syntaxin-17 n=1 Tax=Microplitis demolitor TaxID=69319 RepID=UPI0004CCE531|nr:syntaxin-17 [Microplitis demolitor]
MSETSTMKQPIRRLEIPISKFDVAIPHHLDLLRRHKDNIKKYQRDKDWKKVHKEQTNALRLVKQLEQLLYEMDTLRGQVDDNDIDKFDKLTHKSRFSTITAIQEYLDMKLEYPSSSICSPSTPTEEDGEQSYPLDDRYVQLQTENDEIERQNACLHAWNSLQNDLQQLHQLFIHMNKLIYDQKHHVNEVEDNVIESHENVSRGNKFLEKASKLKVAAYPIAGALIGTCIGGPVGLIAGVKLGGLTALGCGILGFTGASILKKKHLEKLEDVEGMELQIKDKSDTDQQLIIQEQKKDL